LVDPETGLTGLFFSAFLSAPLLPGNSEIAFAALITHFPELRAPALAVATAGNTLGGLVSYAIGRLFPRPRTEPRALAWARRYGVAVLLFSWVPILGDGLCVASGWLRQNALGATIAIAVGNFCVISR
jgi:membrane protein YqaA with SNARE-associated domain